jgi:transcriptional regulator with XRE-family HTH domain
MKTNLRERVASAPLNRLAGNLLKQGRIDGGGDRPLKQEVYARQLAAKLGIPGIARQTLSAWERGTAVVPAAALLASAEVLGVDVGELVENTRDTVRARIAELEALVGTPPSANGSGSAPLRSARGGQKRLPADRQEIANRQS